MAKKWVQKKEPCLQSKEKSLRVWFVSLASISLRSTHTQWTVCFLLARPASFSTNVPKNAAFSQVTRWAAPLQQLSGNPPLGYVWGGSPPGWAGCDCRCHGVCCSHVCRETTAGVKMFGSVWGYWVPAFAWSSRTSWNALNCYLGGVCGGVVGYANSTASSLTLKHQTKSTGVFCLLVEGELWCETSCEHVTFITGSVLMLGNNQGIQFQPRPPGRPVFRYRSKIQYATHGWFSSDILQAGASEHGLAMCQLAWVQ